MSHVPLKLLALLGLGLAACAQAPVGSVQLGYEDGRLYGGSLAVGTTPLFKGRVQLDDNLEKGFWLGTQLTEAWGLEGSVRRCSTDLVEPAPGIWSSQPKVAGLDYAVLEVAAHRSWRLGHFHPYWQAGAGLANLDLEPADAPGRSLRRASFSAGAGAVFWLAPWFGFRFDLRAHAIYLGTRGGGQDQGALDIGRWLRTQEILAGAVVSFGRR